MRTQKVNAPTLTLGVVMILVGLFGFSLTAVAAEEAIAKADQAFEREDFAKAEKLYNGAVKAGVTDGETWFRYGYASYRVDKDRQALKAFERAFELEYEKGLSAYNVSSMYATLSEREPALKWLQIALDHGFDNFGFIRRDEDWDKYRNDDEFRMILARRLRPAVALPGGDAIEFLIGSWSVYDEDGEQIGSARFEGLLDGFAVMEHYEDAGGAETKSMFYFLPNAQTWKQVWVTDEGSVKERNLTAKSDGVTFEGTTTSRDGRTFRDRTVWERTGPAEVTVTVERAGEGGEWQPVHVAVYLRTEESDENGQVEQRGRAAVETLESPSID